MARAGSFTQMMCPQPDDPLPTPLPPAPVRAVPTNIDAGRFDKDEVHALAIGRLTVLPANGSRRFLLLFADSIGGKLAVARESPFVTCLPAPGQSLTQRRLLNQTSEPAPQ